jgi:hypothetical protein
MYYKKDKGRKQTKHDTKFTTRSTTTQKTRKKKFKYIYTEANTTKFVAQKQRRGRRRRKRSRRAHRECRQHRGKWDGRRRIRNTLFKRNGRGSPLAAVFF